jgi:hypothetical protein
VANDATHSKKAKGVTFEYKQWENETIWLLKMSFVVAGSFFFQFELLQVQYSVVYHDQLPSLLRFGACRNCLSLCSSSVSASPVSTGRISHYLEMIIHSIDSHVALVLPAFVVLMSPSIWPMVPRGRPP